MSQDSTPFLFKRSDGFVEASDGNFAVRMNVATGCKDDVCWFTYRPTYQTPSIRVEWTQEHVLGLFPENIARSLIGKGYARQPSVEEVEAFLEDFGDAMSAPSDAEDAQGGAQEDAQDGNRAPGTQPPAAPAPTPPAAQAAPAPMPAPAPAAPDTE